MINPFKQRLIIRLESDSEVNEVIYERPDGISSDDMFWLWFMNVWPALGMNFVKDGIEEND